MKRFIAYTDGAARGNPGPAGAGVVIVDSDNTVIDEAELYLGETTNNVAEYQALLLALERLKVLGAKDILIRADSELMVKQINGEYRVKNQGLRPLFQEAIEQLKSFKSYTIEHVRREENQEADRMANRAIDGESEL